MWQHSQQLEMAFQTLDNKDQHFMELLDNDLLPIEPSLANGGPWLKCFGHSNLLCIRATRVIVNYVPIGKYIFRFFSWKEFQCLYSFYPIETRHYILHECRRYNNYWNPRRNTIAHFILFLEFNSREFSFRECITWLNCSLAVLIISFLFSSCSLHFHVHSYKVAIIVYSWALCNKLLI